MERVNHCLNAQTRHERGIVAHRLLGNALRITLRLRCSDSCLEPSHHGEIPGCRSSREFLFREAHGNPQLTVVQVSRHQGKFETARHYASHDVRFAIEQNLSSQYVRVQSVPPE